MKKLMIAVAVVAAAVSLQAGTCIWGITDYNMAAGTTGGTEDDMIFDGTLMLYMGSIVEASNGDGTYTLDFSKANYVDKSGFDDGTGFYGNHNPAGRTSSEVITSTAKGTEYSLILFEGDIADDAAAQAYKGNYYLLSGLTSTTEGYDAQTEAKYGVFTSGQAAQGDSWHEAGDVPEPTSGLLLLLGVAGLALRRRRA